MKVLIQLSVYVLWSFLPVIVLPLRLKTLSILLIVWLNLKHVNAVLHFAYQHSNRQFKEDNLGSTSLEVSL